MAMSRAPSQASFDDKEAPTSRRGSFIRMASKRIQSLQHSRRQSLVDDDPPLVVSLDPIMLGIYAVVVAVASAVVGCQVPTDVYEQPQYRRRSYGSPPRPVLATHLEDALGNLLRLQSSISGDGSSSVVQTGARHASVTDLTSSAQHRVTTGACDVTSEGLETSANQLRVSSLMDEDGHDCVDSAYMLQTTADHRAASSSFMSTSSHFSVDTDVIDGDQPIRLMTTFKAISPRRSADVKSSLIMSAGAKAGYGTVTELSSLLDNDVDGSNDVLDAGNVGTKGREWCCFLCAMLLHSIQFVAAQLTADTELMFLGHLGTRQLAGAGLARFWIYVPLSFLLSGVGGWRLLFARGFWLQSALVVALLATPLLTCYYFHVDVLVSGTMLHPTTRAFAKQYATLISPSILPLLTSTVLMQYLVARRVVAPVAVMATLACATTIGLHFLLVFGYKHWSGFGFNGSPYSTMATLLLLLLLLVVYGGCCVGFGGLAWRRSSYRLERLRILWAMAVPAGMPSCLQSIVLTIFGAASAYTPVTSATRRRLDESDGMDAGSQQAAAWVVTVCFFLLVLAFLRGAAAATAERMQLHLRRQDVPRARHVLFVGAVYGGALGCIFAATVFKYGAPLLGLWTADAVVLELCVDALPYLAACMALSSVRLVFAAAATIDTWFVQVPLGLALGIGLQLGVLGLWVARLTGELVHTLLLLYALMIDADADDAATPLLVASTDNVADVPVLTAGSRDRSLPVASTPMTNVNGDTLVGMDGVATADVYLEAAPVQHPLEADAPLPWVRRRSSDGRATWVVVDDETALSPISEEGAVRAMGERPLPSASLVPSEASFSIASTATVVSASPAIQW
ncbi:hypothetical protein SPRG_02462 [Saprolegnia parasitica CBS 223.65]|uniref:Uncharacterized protein n=1 Tax=Saprolegnia parasitica (strain CBS 223.65) TaxID=695850 RepID=A0A067CQ12_SAPPC|nr:hypothetical protein SPRG_02462 [Saprolegnia parasitica CBS 223.65]KDO32764.1 hypothetical protein SPRG_02462 [Saprolegnia parasitica CBS 223.65]|eukprot:XP_012196428.1 hypothetical protein SPRG_02462 [Saprolegnia parasitica CBS 223.65]